MRLKIFNKQGRLWSLEYFKQLSVKDQLLYDFTNGYNDNYDNEKNAMKKFFIYKTIVLNKKELIPDNDWFDKYDGLMDPDSKSLFLRNFYYTLWDENIFTTGDTMTSAITPFCQFLNSNTEDFKELMDEQNVWTTNYCIKNHDALENIISSNGKYKDIYYFIMLNHTLGNFIPVPIGFNVARAGSHKNAQHDNWFLTLKKIEEYITGNDENALKKLLHTNSENKISSTLIWLKPYKETKSFNQFIKDNYLQDYCDYENNEYKVKDIFGDYNWNSISKWGILSCEQYKDFFNGNIVFFRKMNEVVLNRTLRMLIEINENKIKKKDVQKVFNNLNLKIAHDLEKELV